MADVAGHHLTGGDADAVIAGWAKFSAEHPAWLLRLVGMSSSDRAAATDKVHELGIEDHVEDADGDHAVVGEPQVVGPDRDPVLAGRALQGICQILHRAVVQFLAVDDGDLDAAHASIPYPRGGSGQGHPLEVEDDPGALTGTRTTPSGQASAPPRNWISSPWTSQRVREPSEEAAARGVTEVWTVQHAKSDDRLEVVRNDTYRQDGPPYLDSIEFRISADVDTAYDAAVRAARAAQPGWWALGGHARARYLYALARGIQKHSRLFAVVESMDNGKSIRETRDFLPQFVDKTPNFPPGEGVRYNNVAFVLLGLVIDRQEREIARTEERLRRRARVVERIVPARKPKLDRIVVNRH